MQTRKRVGVLGWIAAALFVALPLAASAATSSYGANYAFDTNNFRTMVVCDQESDQDNAYTLFDTSSSGTGIRQTDSNGSASGCGSRTVFSNITKHRVCEDQDFVPDPCDPSQNV